MRDSKRLGNGRVSIQETLLSDCSLVYAICLTASEETIIIDCINKEAAVTLFDSLNESDHYLK